MSIICGVFIVYLFLSELGDYNQIKVTAEVGVDSVRCVHVCPSMDIHERVFFEVGMVSDFFLPHKENNG